MENQTMPSKSATRPLLPLVAIAIVFTSNFCTLVLELVASRLMAPIVGVSLYTWTSAIGVILAGISIGNYVGGRLADRHASRPRLALLFILSAFASASVLWLVSIIGSPPIDIPVALGVVLAYAVVFLVPSTILGTISPMVVKLTLTNLDETGSIVGKIYAAGAAGSIGGTFATGFFLISSFGTRTIVWGVAATLLLIGTFIWLSAAPARRLAPVTPLLLFGLVSAVAYLGGWLSSPCLHETNYFCIKVEERDERVRTLILDRLVHSVNHLDEPQQLYYGYEHVYRDVIVARFGSEGPAGTLSLGGGGYTFPRYLEVTYPGSEIVVVEIDPGVTEVAFEEMGLGRNTTIESYNEDARRFLQQRLAADKQYNVIMGDAFNDLSIPFHLTTVEFAELVADHLTDDGIYVANVIDGTELQFLLAYVNTIQHVFEHVLVLPTDGELGELSRQTYVIVASNAPLNDVLADPELAAQTVAPELLAARLAAEQPVLLTDDYVPADNLILPVVEDTGF